MDLSDFMSLELRKALGYNIHFFSGSNNEDGENCEPIEVATKCYTIRQVFSDFLHRFLRNSIFFA